MRLLLNSRHKVLGFWLVITVEGCSLSPQWVLPGDNGGAHGTTPVKPIRHQGAPLGPPTPDHHGVKMHLVDAQNKTLILNTAFMFSSLNLLMSIIIIIPAHGVEGNRTI